MKIGIITYYDVVNYGAVLLSYAMKQTLNAMGHDVVFLRYKREKKNSNGNKSIINRLRRYSPNAIKARKAEEKKIQIFKDFRIKYLDIGDFYDKQQNLDLIIVGSDQIFDCKYEFNNYQFAIDAASDRVISYAPSFGEFRATDLTSFEKKELLKNAIRKFAAHSARDNNTMEILEILTGKKHDRVLDPVLLYGFKKEKKDWNESLIKDRYLIIYAWGGTTVSVEFAENVQAFARKNGLKTVSVGDRRPWCDINYASATPIEFFELYRHCDMVITNMFHGTCFSIINEKPFYSVVMPHNQNKLKDLLEYLDLDKQILYTIDSLKEIEIPQINYSKVKENLESTKNLSMAYLNKAIANCRKE